MSLEEFESRQRYNDYLREVQQEQIYQQAKAGQAKGNMISTQKLNKWVTALLLWTVKIR